MKKSLYVAAFLAVSVSLSACDWLDDSGKDTSSGAAQQTQQVATTSEKAPAAVATEEATKTTPAEPMPLEKADGVAKDKKDGKDSSSKMKKKN